MKKPVSSTLRLVGVGWVLVRYDALAPREISELLPPSARLLFGFLRLFSGAQARNGRPGERLARAFEKLGPVAIKLGQLLATRADIFGNEFADDLGRLKDKLPPFADAVARAQIERTLGKTIASLFSEFGPPVAAASIAQAHRARLHDGRDVAVKVLRPGIDRRVRRDVAAMELGAQMVERLAPVARRLEPAAFVAAIARSLELELDLRLEASAVSELGEIMARDHYMSAPAVVWEGVGRRALTLEWAQGTPLSDPSALDQPGIDRKTLADNVIRGFLAQALDHGTFHADLHEGNLFFSPPAQLVAVDYGIIGRIGPGERKYLAEILWGFIKRDYRRVAEVHFEAGYVPRRHSIDLFAQALRAVGEPVLGRASGDISMGRLLAQLFEITALFDMHLRPELVLLQKTMVTVEGVARRIDVNHDIWEAAKPVVERWIARELAPHKRILETAREAFEALKTIARAAELAVAPPPEPKPEKPSVMAAWALTLALVAVALAAFALGVALN